MPPRPRASEELILRTTIDLIAEHGVAGVSVDAVASVAGVSKPTLYRRWPSRARLLQAAFTYGQHEAVAPDTGSLREDLITLLGELVRYLNRPDFGRAYRSFIEAASRDPELAALRGASMRSAFGMFHRAVRRGIERGELPVGTDVRLFIDMVSAPFMAQRLVEDLPVRGADIEPVVDLLLAAFNRVRTQKVEEFG
ncbi:DNA-binding transcriptional regulator, AcrR family [Parafrankia irregularis]|uniref:DNA-binding transcriptional regulator, AcrR family n=1 Tax=Parafrankia irregularis TaxID=795642 RepID=A0A0S4QW30_9ACTN|nr:MULTISPECIES: TetR/AcrR family transcriptional regulator [Parafrankia]MBE3199962.1 TetR/AcrR family transcriptional regulator [Parafrankia sp. CH37]CUU59294.1 DNA-binding transcriptional regulator, AcrR family [Parafrankia irregularis]